MSDVYKLAILVGGSIEESKALFLVSLLMQSLRYNVLQSTQRHVIQEALKFMGTSTPGVTVAGTEWVECL